MLRRRLHLLKNFPCIRPKLLLNYQHEHQTLRCHTRDQCFLPRTLGGLLQSPTQGFRCPGTKPGPASIRTPADGTVRLAVVLTPGEIAAAVPELAALATWSLPVDAVAETK